MLTQRSRYALRALMVMAKAGDSAPVSMNFIAAEATVPRKFLELILTDLRQAGLVVSFRGQMGGFRLERPPHLLSLGAILRDSKRVVYGTAVSVRLTLSGTTFL